LIENGILCFLFHNLNNSQAQKLDRLQYRALKGALEYGNSAPTNVILAESNEPPMHLRSRYLGRNFLTKCFMTNNHQCIQILRDLNKIMENPRNSMEQHTSLIIECYRDVEFVELEKENVSLYHNYSYAGVMYSQGVYRRTNGDKETPRIAVESCFATDESKIRE
jgi:hypothetical protein